VTVLSDLGLRAALEARRLVVTPLGANAVQPNSIDLRLGAVVLIATPDGYRQHHLTDDGPLRLGVGMFLLGATLERVELDDTLCAFVNGKSSRARQVATNIAGNLVRRANERGRTDALLHHRLTVEGNIVPPTIRVPAGQLVLRFSGRCVYCGGSAFDLDMPIGDVDRPHVSHRGTVLCLLCSRVVAHLAIKSDDERTPAERFRALPSQKSQRGPVPPDGTAMERLVKLLTLGGAMHPDYLVDRLRMSMNVLHNAVSQARRAGHRIETTPQGYRLEVAP
jgi:hypothetical protein